MSDTQKQELEAAIASMTPLEREEWDAFHEGIDFDAVESVEFNTLWRDGHPIQKGHVKAFVRLRKNRYGYTFVVVGRNGRVLMTSQLYSERYKALKAMASFLDATAFMHDEGLMRDETLGKDMPLGRIWEEARVLERKKARGGKALVAMRMMKFRLGKYLRWVLSSCEWQ